MRFKTHTKFSDRRHPEEFSAHWLLPSLRGMWGVPARHKQFIGRETELRRIRKALEYSSNNYGGLTLIETVGIGGVGKTQLAIEYCYRHYEAIVRGDEQRYGLIVWIDAQSKASVSKSFHDLGVDIGLSGLAPMGWTWWLVKKGTPEDRVQILRDALKRALDRESVQSGIKSLGFVPLLFAPEDYAEIVGPVGDQLMGMKDALAWEEEQLSKY